MNEELLDEDGYPTDLCLLQIESYDITERGVEPLLELLESVWYHGSWGFIREGDKLELHTGGWSGNEDIIHVLQKTLFWAFCWESSRRGGHYYFDQLDRFKK